MKRALVFLVICAALAGCKNKPCVQLKSFTDALGTGIATAMTCSNPVAVRQDLLIYAENHGLCTMPTEKGVIGALICPIVIPYVVGFGANKLPPEWGCTGAATSTVLSGICSAVVPI